MRSFSLLGYPSNMCAVRAQFYPEASWEKSLLCSIPSYSIFITHTHNFANILARYKLIKTFSISCMVTFQLKRSISFASRGKLS